MRHTTMYNEGFRYYVFICSGNISYFETLKEAQDYQEQMGGEIGEVW